MPEFANGKNESFFERHKKVKAIILALLINSIFLCASCKTWDSTSINTASSSGSNLLRAIVNYTFVVPENKANKTQKPTSSTENETTIKNDNTLKITTTPKNDVFVYDSTDPGKNKSAVNTYDVKRAVEISKSNEIQIIEDKIIISKVEQRDPEIALTKETEQKSVNNESLLPNITSSSSKIERSKDAEISSLNNESSNDNKIAIPLINPKESVSVKTDNKQTAKSDNIEEKRKYENLWFWSAIIVGAIIILGLLLALAGGIVIYASWIDVCLACLCLFSSITVGILLFFNEHYSPMLLFIPVIACVILWCRGYYLNRSLPKTLLAFPVQIAGVFFVVFLFLLAVGSVIGAFERDTNGKLKNSTSSIIALIILASIFSALGIAAMKVINWLINKGKETSVRLRIEELEATRRKRNGQPKKTIKEEFLDGYKQGLHGDTNSDKQPDIKIIKDEQYYMQVLGIKKNITADNVKKAYYQKTKEYHPDRMAGLGDKLRAMAESEMLEINEAFDFFQRKLNIT